MKVEKDKHATFIFAFRNIQSKEKSYVKLKDFLYENEWIDSKDVNNYDYISFHSNENGTCEITLLKHKIWKLSFEEVLDMLFGDLKACKEIKWIKVIYSPTTDKLVCNNMDYYPQFNSQDCDFGDKICIFYRKTNK